MGLPAKVFWKAHASSGDASLAIDDRYSTTWTSAPSAGAWFEIDLGETADLAGLEVYWGRPSAVAYDFDGSIDRQTWTRLCGTRHGEGGQDVFAFPVTPARFVRWTCEDGAPDKAHEIVEFNLYDAGTAASIVEANAVGVLGYGRAIIRAGAKVTVDLGYERFPLGVLIGWGETYGTDFSVHLSDDGDAFREVGRIATGNGGSDNFWWQSTKARYLRLTIHAASSPEGAIVDELKLRILNKDRMPIGRLERAARAVRGDLYPQSLLGRQVYWTVIGEMERNEDALFDEYGNLEPRLGAGQIMPLLRLADGLHGAPACDAIAQSLADGSLPVPTVTWSVANIELQVTALAHAGQAVVAYRVTNRSAAPVAGSLVLTVRPVQINPYWQHGGHSAINALRTDGATLWVNDQPYAALSPEPDVVTLTDFEEGDVVGSIADQPRQTARSLSSASGLLSGAFEFAFSLPPDESTTYVLASPMCDGVTPRADMDFASLRNSIVGAWRDKIGPRRIIVGDREISDTIEAQTAFILVNATGVAFRPGPRNYDRIWIRDGSSQALALLWAGQVDEAKRYVRWYAKRVDPDGLVPPILNLDGSINTGYGSNIEFDAQGQFVTIVADIFRVTRDRTFLAEMFEPMARATRYIDVLRQKTNASHGPQTRCHGLLPPSISHEGYNKPSFSYWDDFFALSALRNCEYLAAEIGDEALAAYANAKAVEFANDLARSLLMTSAHMGKGLIPGSADRDDVDPTATAIAFEPCRVDDVLSPDAVTATYDLFARQMKGWKGDPDFAGNYSPYITRVLNALVALDRFDDAFELLSIVLDGRRPRGFRGWAEVVWGAARTPDYIGDMPHTWIGAEFATAARRMLLREDGQTLELLRAVPDAWWAGEGIMLTDLPSAFGLVNLSAKRSSAQITIDLALSGRLPERITVRYPGAKRAMADDRPCDIRGDIIAASPMRRLVIEF